MFLQEEVESTKLVYREVMKADVLHDKFQVAPEAQLKRKLVSIKASHLLKVDNSSCSKNVCLSHSFITLGSGCRFATVR